MTRLRSFIALSALTLILSAPAFAEGQAPSAATPAPAKDNQASFEKRKAVTLARIDKRISSLTELKGCVAAANNREDMEKCREKFKEEMETEKAERKRGK